jgi:eukaryotic-like serine/threonine-protein kinase
MGRAEPGRVVAARYRLRTVIRGDDMGAVWLAHDGLRHGDVVLRAIPWAPPSDDEEQESRRERLFNEAHALARLDHPNIVGVLNVAEDDGRPWLVFQATPYRFPYRPLSDVVRNDGPLRPDQAAEVGLQVLAAVRQAHTVGVLHRDIKPGSILLGPGNRVLLTDFCMVTADGLPAMTTLEELTGSPLYMAPERASGEPATPAADLWSLGAALYVAVEGRVPFDRDGTVAVLTAVMGSCPDPPRRAGPLWPVISGLLRKDPGARPDADAMDWLLRRVASGPYPPPRVPAAGAVPQPTMVATPQPQAEAQDAGSAGLAADADNAGPPADADNAGPPADADGAGPAADADGTGSAADADNAGPPADADGAGPADFVPGFGPGEHASTAAKSRVRKAWRQRSTPAGKAR